MLGRDLTEGAVIGWYTCTGAISNTRDSGEGRIIKVGSISVIDRAKLMEKKVEMVRC